MIFRRRRRRAEPAFDPDAGGGGYVPADPRGPQALRSAGPAPGPRDRWLLGLAAPWVEAGGFVHDSWTLLPEQPTEQWRGHLARALDRQLIDTSARWLAALHAFERTEDPLLEEPRVQAWRVSRIALFYRTGVGAGHISAARARDGITQAAGLLPVGMSDWLDYGDAFLDGLRLAEPSRHMEYRATVRLLYAEGGPWADLTWPQGPGGDGAG